MTAETLRLSAGAFRVRGVALWERILRLTRRAPRRLRLCESLPLGDRRFVAVVEFDAERFLVGGTPSSLVLLSRLEHAGGVADNTSGDASWSSAEALKKRRSEKC